MRRGTNSRPPAGLHSGSDKEVKARRWNVKAVQKNTAPSSLISSHLHNMGPSRVLSLFIKSVTF